MASLDIILSEMRITKSLIRLRGCAGWSATLLVANPRDRFSRSEAHLKQLQLFIFLIIYLFIHLFIYLLTIC